MTGIKILVLREQLRYRRSKKDQTPFFEECYILQIVVVQVQDTIECERGSEDVDIEIWQVTDTDTTNEVRWVIRLLHSTREQIALDNAGAVALFVFPIFLLSLGGKNHVLRPSVL